MNPIKQLDYALVNKIAAGEVVERPLSVVKELTENAIDAGASVITVEIHDGGLTGIRVTDNGGGIPSEQLPLAFARHATSKIATLDDLFGVTTLGFRGEALSSIAAVAQVELITKTPFAVTGARIEIHGGREISNQAIGCADGTTLVVSNLFFNTPARRKFMKKPSTEAGYISDLMQKLALCNPGIAFRYISDGRLVLQTNGGGDLKTAMHYVYGREISSKLITLHVVNGPTLDGYIGKPEIARGNRSYGHFFLNGRYIKSTLLQQAVEAGMSTMLMNGRFPVYALHMSIDPEEVDVNVHPNKMDVRFSNEESIYHFVREAVYGTLTDNSLIPEVSLSKRKPAESEPERFEEQRLPMENDRAREPEAPKRDKPYVQWESKTKTANKTMSDEVMSFHEALPNESIPNKWQPGKPLFDALQFNGACSSESKTQAVNDSPANLPATEASPFFREYTIHGLLFNTYWLVEQGDSLYLIDQHAAHERVLYEEIMTSVKSGPIHAQPLLEAMPLRLTPKEAQTIRDNAGFFEQFGFELADDGKNIAVKTVPYVLKNAPVFFTELLDKLEQPVSTGVIPISGSLYEHKANIIAMASCKAAVKANDRLSEPEARALIVKMLALPNPFTCPHGRPTIIEITKRELERKFKRVI